jgi:hypothetical protein
MPYTSLNGHMFSVFTKSDFVSLRLPPRERQEFLDRYDARLTEQYGIVQKEYVHVPDDLLERTDELRPWFEASLAYVSAMKPKPTTRKRV